VKPSDRAGRKPPALATEDRPRGLSPVKTTRKWPLKPAPLLLAVLTLCACRTTPEWALGDRAVDLARIYSPLVCELLETSTPHEDITVMVTDLDGNTAAAVNEERDTIGISPRMLDLPEEALAWVVVHELAHLNLTGYWTTLPTWVEEGVAESVAVQLLPPLHGPGGPSKEYRLALACVQEIGFEEVRLLCIKAHEQGLTRIPDGWLPAACLSIGPDQEDPEQSVNPAPEHPGAVPESPEGNSQDSSGDLSRTSR
jgi:hypothetical protein